MADVETNSENVLRPPRDGEVIENEVGVCLFDLLICRRDEVWRSIFQVGKVSSPLHAALKKH